MKGLRQRRRLSSVLVAWPAGALADPPPVGVAVTASVCDTTEVMPAITDPPDGSVTLVPTQVVTGTGTPDGIINVYRNGVLAGTAPIDSAGDWTLTITLVPNTNLIAAVGCVGTATITVTYQAPIPPSPSPSPPGPTPAPTATPTAAPPTSQPPAPSPAAPGQPGRPGQPSLPGLPAAPFPAPVLQLPGVVTPPIPPDSFILTTPQSSLSAVVGETTLVYFTIHNGTFPYSLKVDWGDGEVDQQLISQRGTVTLGHRYKKAGRYHVQVKLRDKDGREAVMSYVILVEGGNGQASALVGHQQYPPSLLFVFLAGQLLLLALIFVLWEYYHQRSINAAEPR